MMTAMPSRTTCMTSIVEDVDCIIKTAECYPIVGPLLTEGALKQIMEACFGLNTFWDCLRKAYVVKQYLGYGDVVAGQCMILSADGSSSYGHYWNPPYEFHAWWQPQFIPGVPMPIIDVALPGLIKKGSSSRDEIGFMLTGRSPLVLAGRPEDWMQYKGSVAIDDSQVV